MEIGTYQSGMIGGTVQTSGGFIQCEKERKRQSHVPPPWTCGMNLSTATYFNYIDLCLRKMPAIQSPYQHSSNAFQATATLRLNTHDASSTRETGRIFQRQGHTLARVEFDFPLNLPFLLHLRCRFAPFPAATGAGAALLGIGASLLARPFVDLPFPGFHRWTAFFAEALGIQDVDFEFIIFTDGHLVHNGCIDRGVVLRVGESACAGVDGTSFFLENAAVASPFEHGLAVNNLQ